MAPVARFVITPRDRRWFNRCRRAWISAGTSAADLQAGPPPGGPADGSAVREALAVYHFPGMWDWDRSIVIPLVMAAFDRVGGGHAERELVAAFVEWAPTLDPRTPVRVEADLDVAVPDPVISENDLAASDGDGVRFHERVPLVVVDEADRSIWIVRQRIVDHWASGDELALDEDALVTAWAWQQAELAMPIAGVIHDELRVAGPDFRRTVVPLEPDEIAGAGRRLGRTAMAMLDAMDLRPRPTPDWSHCARCHFRRPCLAMNRGADAEPLLAAGYRIRPSGAPVEGRLGGRTWSTGRGARPNLFDRR